MVPFQRLPTDPPLLLLLRRHPIPPIHPILSHRPDLQPVRICPRFQRNPPRPRLHRTPPTPIVILHRRRGRTNSHRPHRRLGRRRRRNLIRRNKPKRPAGLGRLVTSPHRINRPIIGKRRLPSHRITDQIPQLLFLNRRQPARTHQWRPCSGSSRPSGGSSRCGCGRRTRRHRPRPMPPTRVIGVRLRHPILAGRPGRMIRMTSGPIPMSPTRTRCGNGWRRARRGRRGGGRAGGCRRRRGGSGRTGSSRRGRSGRSRRINMGMRHILPTVRPQAPSPKARTLQPLMDEDI